MTNYFDRGFAHFGFVTSEDYTEIKLYSEDRYTVILTIYAKGVMTHVTLPL
jgi:hypothetical protein